MPAPVKAPRLNSDGSDCPLKSGALSLGSIEDAVTGLAAASDAGEDCLLACAARAVWAPATQTNESTNANATTDFCMLHFPLKSMP
jgi:hypothetical protein